MKVHYSSTKHDWETPKELFDTLNAEFGFTLDAAATADNAKCMSFFTETDDGLSQDWSGHNVFCNPPYGRSIGKWIEKAYSESLKPNTTVVMLIPARTDTKAWHEFIFDKAEIRFLKGRIKFITDGQQPEDAPFPSAVVIFRK